MARRRVVSLVAGGLLALAAALVASSGAALATQPVEHKVDICHAVPPDTAANGYNLINVDVASVGYQNSGHQNQHDADIIPAWSYTDNGQTFSFAGKNWDDEGQAIWRNGCVVPGASPTATPTETAAGETATATPYETAQGETATPVTSVPPTNTGGGPLGGSTPLFALLISFAFGGLGLTAVQAQKRTIRR